MSAVNPSRVGYRPTVNADQQKKKDSSINGTLAILLGASSLIGAGTGAGVGCFAKGMPPAGSSKLLKMAIGSGVGALTGPIVGVMVAGVVGIGYLAYKGVKALYNKVKGSN